MPGSCIYLTIIYVVYATLWKTYFFVVEIKLQTILKYSYSVTMCNADEGACDKYLNGNGPACPYNNCRSGVLVYILLYAKYAIIFLPYYSLYWYIDCFNR